MYKGTLIDELFTAVERAERIGGHASSKSAHSRESNASHPQFDRTKGSVVQGASNQIGVDQIGMDQAVVNQAIVDQGPEAAAVRDPKRKEEQLEPK